LNKAPEPKSLEDRINTWVQIIGILVAGAWAGYAFFYKEIWLPEGAPVNVSLNLEIHQAESGVSNKDGLRAYSLVAAATNPSTRQVKLFKSIWIVYGYRIGVKTSFDLDEAAKALNADDLRMTSRFFDNQNVAIVATGRLFEDEALEPQEKIGRTEVLYVPDGVYDALELAVFVPNVSDDTGLDLSWKLTAKGPDNADVNDILMNKSTGKLADEKLRLAHLYAVSMARVKIPLSRPESVDDTRPQTSAPTDSTSRRTKTGKKSSDGT
jgi:hypothetical protein